jgi:hypothetical protein
VGCDGYARHSCTSQRICRTCGMAARCRSLLTIPTRIGCGTAWESHDDARAWMPDRQSDTRHVGHRVARTSDTCARVRSAASWCRPTGDRKKAFPSHARAIESHIGAHAHRVGQPYTVVCGTTSGAAIPITSGTATHPCLAVGVRLTCRCSGRAGIVAFLIHHAIIIPVPVGLRALAARH